MCVWSKSASQSSSVAPTGGGPAGGVLLLRGLVLCLVLRFVDVALVSVRGTRVGASCERNVVVVVVLAWLVLFLGVLLLVPDSVSAVLRVRAPEMCVLALVVLGAVSVSCVWLWLDADVSGCM